MEDRALTTCLAGPSGAMRATKGAGLQVSAACRPRVELETKLEAENGHDARKLFSRELIACGRMGSANDRHTRSGGVPGCLSLQSCYMRALNLMQALHSVCVPFQSRVDSHRLTLTQPAMDHILANMDSPVPSAAEQSAASSSAAPGDTRKFEDDDMDEDDRAALAAHIAKMGGKAGDGEVVEAKSVKCTDVRRPSG